MNGLPDRSYAVYLGLDVGKGEHHACALDPTGRRLHDKPLPQDETRLRALFEQLSVHGPVLVVVDQPASIGALPVAVARAAGVDVAYLPGLAMRRIADLHPGNAKTDARDARVIAEAARTMPHTLTSMPGIGVRTAARILLEVGDGTAFPTPGHLAAYAGLAPVTRRSGSSIRSEHPSRAGNKNLKNALWQSAFASLHHPPSRAYYDRKRAQGKKHNTALICLARRRRDVLHAMLRNRTPYQPPAPAAA